MIELTLRKQIQYIGANRINPAFVDAVSFYTLVTALAVRAFHEQWPESTETRAVRRALDCFYRPNENWVSEDEPSVK